MPSGNTMGVDFGIINPAVCYVLETKNIRFIGNGERWAHLKRRHKKLADKKHASPKITQFSNDEIKQLDWDIKNNRKSINIWKNSMVNDIIMFAKEEKVKVIKVEDLRVAWHLSFHVCDHCGYRHESLKNLHKRKIEPIYGYACIACNQLNRAKNKEDIEKYQFWSIGSIVQLLEYRCENERIKVIRIDPYNTSKQCPICGALNKSEHRIYRCACGFEEDRDVVGAMNVAKSVDLIHKWNEPLERNKQ